MLSREQQKIIENSIWVVNSALKRQGLQQDEDLRQSAILYMCKCLERFCPNKDTKWTTYAYKSVYLFIKRTHHKEVRKQRLLVSDGLEELLDAEEPNDSESAFLLDKIYSICEQEEQEILDLKMQGFTREEIGEIMGLTVPKVKNKMKKIREKARELEV